MPQSPHLGAGRQQLIERTAQHFNSSECASSGSFPNNLYGWGLVNAGRAAKP